ncbi:MAG: hypothetical protein KF905_05995 [Flavobacteriales bacterium]|nr:hypothetical protein [Flavobacteriales bacterium]
MSTMTFEKVKQLLTGSRHTPNYVEEHPLIKVISNTFAMDKGRHRDQDAFLHYVIRNAEIAMATHGKDQRIHLYGTFPEEANLPHFLSFGIYFLHDGSGSFTIADEPTFEGNRIQSDTSRIGFTIEIIGPSAMTKAPIEDNLHHIRYR